MNLQSILTDPFLFCHHLGRKGGRKQAIGHVWSHEPEIGGESQTRLTSQFHSGCSFHDLAPFSLGFSVIQWSNDRSYLQGHGKEYLALIMRSAHPAPGLGSRLHGRPLPATTVKERCSADGRWKLREAETLFKVTKLLSQVCLNLPNSTDWGGKGE